MPCLEPTSLAEKWANVCMWLIWDGLFLGRRKSLVKRTDGGGVGCFCVPHRWEPQRIPSADPFHSLKNYLSSVSTMTLNYECNCQVASDIFWNIKKHIQTRDFWCAPECAWRHSLDCKNVTWKCGLGYDSLRYLLKESCSQFSSLMTKPSLTVSMRQW